MRWLRALLVESQSSIKPEVERAVYQINNDWWRAGCKGSLSSLLSCISHEIEFGTWMPGTATSTVSLSAHTAHRTTHLRTAMRGLIGHRPLQCSQSLQNRACLGQCSSGCRVAARRCSQANQQQLRLHAAAVDAEVEQQTDAATQTTAEPLQNVAVASSHVSACSGWTTIPDSVQLWRTRLCRATCSQHPASTC
jgi:CTP:molybdopterin cytidylyltransferase MocA